jgi:hypothetical protein
MKKFLFGFAALALLATASCKKDDDTASGPSNRIVVNGETLAVTSVSSTGSIVAVTAGSSSTTSSGLLMSFGTGTAKPSNGTYKVVSNADAADEVDITLIQGGNINNAYDSQDGSNVNVTVGADGGKMTIVLPEITMKKSGASETIKVSANAREL